MLGVTLLIVMREEVPVLGPVEVAVSVTVFEVPWPDVVSEVFILAVVPPLVETVTEFTVVSNSKPVGAFKIMLPVDIPALSVSVITGPVKVVYAPVPPVAAVSAEMAPPPVAVVMVAVASALPTQTNAKAKTNKKAMRMFMVGFISS